MMIETSKKDEKKSPQINHPATKRDSGNTYKHTIVSGTVNVTYCVNESHDGIHSEQFA